MQIIKASKVAIHQVLKYIKENDFQSFPTHYKQNNNVVSDCDVRLQDIILKTLSLEFPEGFIVYSEELEKPTIFSKPRFKIVIDPLDQTSSFIYGNLEFASTSILILEVDKVVQFERFGYVRVDSVDGEVVAYFTHK